MATKKILIWCLAFLYTLVVSSCSNSGTNNDWIVGDWYDEDGWTITFNADGSFYFGDDCTTNGTFTIKDNTVHLKGKTKCEGEDETEKYDGTLTIEGEAIKGFEKDSEETFFPKEDGYGEEEMYSPPTPKNNLITIRLEAISNSKANNGVSNIRCNYGDGDYRVWGGYNFRDSEGVYLGELFSSGYITVPSGKTWIYKDAKLIKGVPSSYKSDAVIAKKNDKFIRLNAKGFTGITLHERNVFRVLATAMDYDNRTRQVPDGNVVGVELTFIEIEY